MDEEIKIRFNELDKSVSDNKNRLERIDQDVRDKLDLTQKRIDDNKTLVTVLISSITIIFSVFSFIAAMNFKSEKDGLRDFQQGIDRQVEKAIGSLSGSADLKIYTSSGKVIDEEVVDVRVISNSGSSPGKIVLPFVIRNHGSGAGKNIILKAYTKDPIKLEYSAAFEDDYTYEVYASESSHGIPNIPANEHYAHPVKYWVFVENPVDIDLGTYDTKLKLFYDDKLKEVEFKIRVTENLTRR